METQHQSNKATRKMTKLSNLLNKNFPYGSTEVRPSLETHVSVSCEGLLNTIKKAFTGTESKKGAKGKLTEDKKHILDIGNFLEATYTNDKWLNKQRFHVEDVSGDSIVSVLTQKNSTPEQLLTTVRSANAEVKGYREQWIKAVDKYLKEIIPAKRIIIEGEYTPDNLKEVKSILTKASKELKDNVKFPMTYATTGHRVVKSGNTFNIPVNNISNKKITPLHKEQVSAVSKELATGINDYLNTELEQYFSIDDTVDEVDVSSDLIRGKLRELKENKDEWTRVITSLNASDILYSNEHVTALFDHYNEVMMSVTRYIDRSIV